MNKYRIVFDWEPGNDTHYMRKVHMELIVWANDEREARESSLVTLWETDIKADLIEFAGGNLNVTAEDVT